MSPDSKCRIARPFKRFIRMTTIRKTKVTRKEKASQDSFESGSMGMSENSSSPTNMVIVFTRLVQGPSK